MKKDNELKGSSDLEKEILDTFAEEVSGENKGSSEPVVYIMEEKATPEFPNTSEGHKMKQMWFKLLKKSFTTPIKMNEDGSVLKGRFVVEYFTEVDKVTKLKVEKFKYIRL